MAVNPDAAKRLTVRIREPRQGSCLTPALIAELAELIEVTESEASSDGGSGACVSKDPNNLATLDAQNCILVPAAKLYIEDGTWAVSPGTEIEFNGFTGEGIDPTKCLFSCYLFLDSAETGIEVKKEPTGTAFIRPNYEITVFTAAAIKIQVHNATRDARLQIQLLSLPVAQQQT